MVKAYFRYKFDASFGVITTNHSNIVHLPRSKQLLVTAS